MSGIPTSARTELVEVRAGTCMMSLDFKSIVDGLVSS